MMTEIKIYETYYAGGVQTIWARDNIGYLRKVWYTASPVSLTKSRIFSPNLTVCFYNLLLSFVHIPDSNFTTKEILMSFRKVELLV